jgi:hypothetical protein
MDTKNLKIEKTFVNVKFSEREVTEFKSQVSSAEVDIQKLKKYFDFKNISELKQFANSEYIKKFLEQGETEFIGKTFIPQSEKKRIHAQYEDVFRDTAAAADTIKNLFDNYHFTFGYDAENNKLTYNEDEVRKFYDNKYMVVLSDSDIEYFNKICNVMKSLQECSDWEVSNGYFNFTKNGDSLYPLENVYTMWQRGYFDGTMFQAMLGGRIGKISHHKEQED